MFKKRRIWGLEEKRAGKFLAEWKWSFSVTPSEKGERKSKSAHVQLAVLSLCHYVTRESAEGDSLVFRETPNHPDLCQIDS